MNRRPRPPVAANPREGVKGALLHTLPGRAIVIGLAIKAVLAVVGLLLGRVPAFFAVVDTVAGLAAVVGLAYFGFRLIVLAQRRLLWRVRRKLILSYVFIGLIPALLLVLFSLLVGFLLFYNFSSYLVQSRLKALSEQARFLAQSTALEIQRAGGRDAATIISHRQANADGEYPDISIAVVSVNRACGAEDSGAPAPASQPSDFRLLTSGPWAHVDPPRVVPVWIDCRGFSGVLAYSHPRVAGSTDIDTHLLVRGVAFPDATHPSYAVIVDLLVNDAIRQQLRKDTGVELKTLTVVPGRDGQGAKPLTGLSGGEHDAARTATAQGLFTSLPSLMEYR